MTPTPSKEYRKKPVVIQAVEWTGANIEEVLAFMAPLENLPSDGIHVQPGVGHCLPLGTLDIPTLEGVMTAKAGDWIIRGVKGEFYPCKPDIFAATYEAVDAPPLSRETLNDEECDRIVRAVERTLDAEAKRTNHWLAASGWGNIREAHRAFIRATASALASRPAGPCPVCGAQGVGSASSGKDTPTRAPEARE